MDQVFYSKSGLSSLKPPRTMQIKIGQIYKVKPEFRRNYCIKFNDTEDAAYIRFFDNKHYNVLNQNKDVIDWCDCFKPEHLEPLEKTLYNLEVNDFVKEESGCKRKVLGLIESSPENPVYALSLYLNYEYAGSCFSAKQLENIGYKVVQPELTEEIKEMTVEEVSKLVGKKVKIVE
jgi:hypothetical protein